MCSRSDSGDMVRRLERLIMGYRELATSKAPSLLERFERLLDGFGTSLKGEEDTAQHTHTSIEILLSGYRNAREDWAREQRASADDFNLFEVMEIEQSEICHSRLLAWMLDHRIERGTHAQGNLGFRLFLEELEAELDPDSQRNAIAYADECYWVRVRN